MTLGKTDRAVAVGILDFLTRSISNGSVSSEDKDSIQVAVECISEVFNVNIEDKERLLGNESLSSIVEKFQNLYKETDEAVKASTPVASASTSASANGSVSEDDKKEAEKLKVEGNRFMAQQNFADAVGSYTQAINKNPQNAVYYSNRSAAYSSLRKSNEAADDARKALAIDPTYSKAYSRLGLALYSLGDAQGAMDAYEAGIKSEGDSPSEGMKKGYETAKKRVQEELESSVPGASPSENATDGSAAATSNRSVDPASPAGGAGGFPDFSSLLGGAGGGMPDLSQLMNDPTIRNMAQNLMSNPSALSGLMNNPTVQRMRDRAQSGQMPSMSDIMSDPSLQDLARSFLGGADGTQPPGDDH